MATITLTTAAYNDAKQYAETQNLTVDEFVVSLIKKYAHSKKRKKYKMQPNRKAVTRNSRDFKHAYGWAA